MRSGSKDGGHKTRNVRFICVTLFSLLAAIPIHFMPTAVAQEATSRLSDSSVFLTIHTVDQNNMEDTITGSGVLVTPQGHVLTSAHILPDLADPAKFKSVEVRGVIGTKYGYPIELERTGLFNVKEDIAFLKFPLLPGVNFRPAIIPEAQEVKQGDGVTILGFPIGLDLNETRGIITSLNGNSGRLVTDTQLAAGSSGGPAFDVFGRLIGIVSSGYQDETTGELIGLNLLVPISVAKSVASGISWVEAATTKSLECKGRRLEIVGEGLVPNEGALEPIRRDLKLGELPGILSSGYPWLVVNGGKMLLSALGEQVVLRFCKIELRSGAKLIVGRSRVSILANQIVSENGGIIAFENTTAPTPPEPVTAVGALGKSGDPGNSAGSVLLAVLDQVAGNLYVRLDGTHGTAGGAGGPGALGADGPPGRGGSDSLFDCKRGPGDGGRGLPGSPGAPGGAGGVGGNAGDLTILKLTTTKLAESQISFSGLAGEGGAGGPGGPGGRGGEGGQSGKETFYCKGGRDGPRGPSGPAGAVGAQAPNGIAGAFTFTSADERAIIDLF